MGINVFRLPHIDSCILQNITKLVLLAFLMLDAFQIWDVTWKTIHGYKLIIWKKYDGEENITHFVQSCW